MYFSLGPHKMVTQRVVYDFLTLLSDVGGFQGTIVQFVSIGFSFFYSSQLVGYQIYKKTFFKPQSRKRQQPNLVSTLYKQGRKLGNSDLIELLHKVSTYKSPSINFLYPLCFSRCARNRWLPVSQRRELVNIEKANALVEKALDVRNLVSLGQKVDLILHIMFTKQERWLLQRQPIKGGFLINYYDSDDGGERVADDFDSFRLLHSWKVKGRQPVKLVKGLFSN